ncbi:FixH family protein [Paenibacillus macquariensis]|uniref:YtkA-like n=1 Tax=Paenibacillus macquariensis TaxID=948756 RepID=A0ABY1JUR2_9BACL|nr:FixH family protein [Paenibacillus macquariensis]MEC0090925.1 FixH family protein [Paenibacillus macquariensis]OAB34654.1 hypothetical protein PMSM_12440 [Paenibacillus macquariensis subsp. macquariensis]SIQ80572.1 YtkA-like [Paenibacillus macquariensis]
MRRMIAGTSLLLILLTGVVGCSSASKDHAGMDMVNDGSLSPVIVELSIQPDPVKVKENVKIEVLVTQNNKQVTDADKVSIEIVPTAANGKHIEMPAKHVGDGKYVLETSFDQADKYSVTSHVTVGAMHTMPKKEITVTD